MVRASPPAVRAVEQAEDPLDQCDIDIALQEAQILEDDGRPVAAACVRACARAAQTLLRERG